MFADNDPHLELMKTQEALEILSSVLSEAEYQRICSALVQHRDRIRDRLQSGGRVAETDAGREAAEPVQHAQMQTLAAWVKFISSGEIDSQVNPVVANSWKRCWARVNPVQEINPVRLNPNHLLSIQVASFDLISVSRPIMEDIYQCIENTGSVIALINSAGCMLDRIGDGEILSWLDRWGLTPGSFLTEELLGTNAVGLALAERASVQVVGAEHYLKQLHPIAGAAAPMFSINGRLLGALGVFMMLEKYHYYSLGLATASARAVEGQHQSDMLLFEQNSQLAQLNTIISAISDGILVWNREGTLLHVNQAAGNILGIPARSMVGKPVEACLDLPIFMNEAIAAQKSLTDVETTFTIGHRSINCLMNLDFVYNKNELQWIIVTLRTEKQVRSLVAQQVGASAGLTLEDIPGESTHIQQVRNFIRLAAKAQACVLIRGEVGTGKNALANAIHDGSRRREGPFVGIACSSIPTELIVRELLGFSEGGDGRRPGSRPSKFELAEGGTIYFQDIDALPLDAQGVLLNALASGRISRLGNQRPIDTDVRVIASTSAPLEKLIAQGSFRPELFYWLSTFSITLPALRERPGDILLIVERILRRLAEQWGLSRLSLGPGVIEALMRYSWPGNIREVESVLGRAATQVGASSVITLNLLPPAIYSFEGNMADKSVQPAVQSMLEVEREAILRTAQICKGNVKMMAQSLEMSRTTLWRRMREFDIQPDAFREGSAAPHALKEVGMD